MPPGCRGGTRRSGDLAVERPSISRRGRSFRSRTCRWSSWWTSCCTIRRGPRRPVRGPTKTLTAPARTKRSTRSCASARSIWADAGRRQLLPVAARVVDVDVEAVLVRGVAEPAEPRPEVAAARPAEVADPDPRRVRVGEPVLGEDAQHRAHEARRAPAAPGPVRRPLQDRVPGEVVRPSRVSCTPLARRPAHGLARARSELRSDVGASPGPAQVARTSGSARGAQHQPADPREAGGLELVRDSRDRLDPAFAGDANEHPLVGVAPAYEDPAPVRRPGDVVEDAGSGEHPLRAAARDVACRARGPRAARTSASGACPGRTSCVGDARAGSESTSGRPLVPSRTATLSAVTTASRRAVARPRERARGRGIGADRQSDGARGRRRRSRVRVVVAYASTWRGPGRQAGATRAAVGSPPASTSPVPSPATMCSRPPLRYAIRVSVALPPQRGNRTCGRASFHRTVAVGLERDELVRAGGDDEAARTATTTPRGTRRAGASSRRRSRPRRRRPTRRAARPPPRQRRRAAASASSTPTKASRTSSRERPSRAA